MSDAKILIVMTAIDSEQKANTLAHSIIEKHLAGCVQILPKMRSVYRWEGKIEKVDECLLLIKTSNDRFNDLEEYILTDHSYETPEIIAVEAAAISYSYLGWLMDSNSV